MEQIPLSTYATALLPELPREVFALHPWRLAWLALHVAVAAAAIAVIALGWGGLAVAAPLALVIGHSFACMAFVGHETLHGSTVRRHRARHHVEHHLFPKMSPAQAPRVRALLREKWPERYQSLPLLTALWRLARTPRIHLTAETLIEPRSGRRWPTLLPRPDAANARRLA